MASPTLSSFTTLSPGSFPVMVLRTSAPSRVVFPSTGLVVAVINEVTPPSEAKSCAGSGALYVLGSAWTNSVVNGSLR